MWTCPFVCLLSKGNVVTTIDINQSEVNHIGRSHISQHARVMAAHVECIDKATG